MQLRNIPSVNEKFIIISVMQSFTAIIGLNDSRFPGGEIIFELIVQNKVTKDEIRVTFSLHLLLFKVLKISLLKNKILMI
jgi:hypothetical protein